LGQLIDFAAAKAKLELKKSLDDTNHEPVEFAPVNDDDDDIAELGQCPLCSAPAFAFPDFEDFDRIRFAPEAIDEFVSTIHEDHKQKLITMSEESEEMDSKLNLLAEKLMVRTDRMSELMVRKQNQKLRTLLLDLMEEYSGKDHDGVKASLWEEAEKILNQRDNSDE
jgi:hypothetical protein